MPLAEPTPVIRSAVVRSASDRANRNDVRARNGGAEGNAATSRLTQLKAVLNSASARTPAFGSAVVQCVAAGRYRTSDKGNLRGKDKKVIEAVPSGAVVIVAPGAETLKFDLGTFSTKKDHTWVTVESSLNRGWLRDSLLNGTPLLEEVRRDEKEERKVAYTPTKSLAIGSSASSSSSRTSAFGSPATITEQELEEYRTGGSGELVSPGPNKGARPLGLGKPSAGNFRCRIHNHRILDSTGARLTIDSAPFVLSEAGALFGGPDSESILHKPMENHGQPGVDSPAWAGMLAADDGIVTAINNQSGTFMLKDQSNINLIKFLYRNGALSIEQVRELDVRRVYAVGLDRDAPLEPHHAVT